MGGSSSGTTCRCKNHYSLPKKEYIFKVCTLRALISDGGSHFCNAQLTKVLQHYSVKHKVSMYIMQVLMMPNLLLDDHGLNQVNKQHQENLR